MSTKRCFGCDLNWPNNSEFAVCVGCGERTVYRGDLDSMPWAEVPKMRRRLAFEKHYAERGPRPLHWKTQQRVDVIVARAQREQDVLMQLRELAESWQ